MPFYSAVCIRTGDKSTRPIASECIAVDVPEDQHKKLYAELDELRKAGTLTTRIEGKSAILDYIASSPPNEPNTKESRAWQWVKYIKDFPFLSDIVMKEYDGLLQFQEPIRTMEMEEICGLMAKPSVTPLGVFQHSKLMRQTDETAQAGMS